MNSEKKKLSLAAGARGAQPTWLGVVRQTTHAGAHMVPGVQIQP